jgi:hypothetical protein
MEMRHAFLAFVAIALTSSNRIDSGRAGRRRSHHVQWQCMRWPAAPNARLPSERAGSSPFDAKMLGAATVASGRKVAAAIPSLVCGINAMCAFV